jgi:hypothetical protein
VAAACCKRCEVRDAGPVFAHGGRVFDRGRIRGRAHTSVVRVHHAPVNLFVSDGDWQTSKVLVVGAEVSNDELRAVGSV